MFLFLDFDGVLHPFFPRADRSDAQNQHWCHVPLLETWLRRHPEVKVVVSSSWRAKETHNSVEKIGAMFSPDVRPSLIGMTPVLAGGHDRGSRHAEVIAWLKNNGQEAAPWVALDDMPDLYRPGDTVVVAPDGLFDAQLAELDEAVADPAAWAAAHPVEHPESPTFWLPAASAYQKSVDKL